MHIVGIILTISNLFLILIMWGMTIGIHKPKNGKIFGINMPTDRFNDERVLEIVNWYLKRDKWWFRIGLLTAFLPLYRTPYYSIIHSIFIIWTTGIIVYKGRIFAKTMKKLRELKQTCGWFDPVRDEEEQYWYGGVFYNNPNSKKMFTSKYQVGMGSTVNLATKGGKIFMIVTGVILVIALIPTWGLILVDDFVPPSINLTDDRLIIKSAFSKASAEFDEIESVLWTDALKIGTKSNGSSTALYSRGTFFVGDYGKSYVYRFKAFPQLIVVEVKDSKPIIFNLKTLEETEAIYRELLLRIK